MKSAKLKLQIIELNTVLLNRKNGELKLTEEGKILFNNLVIIFDKIDTFENSVKASNNEYDDAPDWVKAVRATKESNI